MGRFSSVKAGIENSDFSSLFDALDYYDAEIKKGQDWLDSIGIQFGHDPVRVSDVQKRLGGLMTFAYNLSQEAEQLKRYMESVANARKIECLKQFKEHYNRDLSDRIAEKYSEADSKFLQLKEIAGEIELRFNQLTGFTKGLEMLNFQAQSYTKLIVAGLEDATF